MSIVVAIKENGIVYMGSDSQATKSGLKTILKNSNNYKIWPVKNVENCFMAHVGNLRDANVIRVDNDMISEYDVFKNNVDYEFVVKKIVPQIFSDLKNAGYLKDEQYIEFMDSSFIFAYEDKLYSINNDGCVLEIDDYVAMGSGAEEALGSLLSTIGENPQERLIKAIKASALSNVYVDYPIITVDTKTDKFTIFEK